VLREGPYFFIDADRQPGVSRYRGQLLSRAGLTRSGASDSKFKSYCDRRLAIEPRPRLLELAEVPPHFLKFDMRFIRGIDAAPPSRRRLLTSLVAVARDLLVYTVAEGVETKAEADVCSEIGFTHAQGFHFGVPRPVEEL